MRFVVLPLWASLSAFGCGGSSSETPPPLPPDPTSERYTGPRMPSAADEIAESPAAPPEDDGLDQPRKPAPATWGSGKNPTSAPKMTSPTALPPSTSNATPSPATPAGSAAPGTKTGGAPLSDF